MRKKLHFVILIVISLFMIAPKANSQDVGATFCWHYNEMYGGHSYPYNNSIAKEKLPDGTAWGVTTQWWENMAEEIDYSGVDFIALLSRGNQPNAPDRGNGNPKHIYKMVDAMDARGADFKLAIFDDCPNSWTGSRNWDISGGASYSTDNPKFDCASTANYKYIWDYNLKQAIGSIPDAKRYKIDGRMVIFFWSAKTAWMTNLQGNLSKILTYIKNQCQTVYGFKPYCIVDKDWLDNDNTLSTSTVDGVHGWFSSGSGISYTLETWNGRTYGAGCPGLRFAGEADYLDPSIGTTDNGKRLKLLLDNTVKKGARTTLVEGFTDAAECAALWRSNDNTYYDYPNQRLNILRRYTSTPYPSSLKMEAEACDAYSDLSTGNSGGTFLYSGNLDVEKCSDGKGGWNVTGTQANEWMEWKELPLLTNTKFQIRYKSTAASSVKFSVDGTALSIINLPSTSDVWTTVDAGVYTNASNGLHTVRLTIVSGTPEVNYFLRVANTNFNVTLQAESATLSGAVVGNTNTGFLGTGYADFVNASTDYVEFTVNNVPVAGNYDLTFRYAVPNAGRLLKLTVNTVVKVASLDFPGTGDFNTWGTLKSTQALTVGTNKIRLTATGTSGSNIDQLVVSTSTLKSAKVNSGVDISSVQNEMSVNVYPNPYKGGNLYISMPGFENQANIQIRVSNLMGQTVYQQTMNNTSHLELNLSNELKGSLYFISVEAGAQKIVKKLIVN